MIGDGANYDTLFGSSSYTDEDAEKLIRLVTENLKLPVNNIVPAYEDLFYYAWVDKKMPVNINVNRINFANELERKSLGEILDGNASAPAGYVLPLNFSFDINQWISCAWELKSERMNLIPGISPLGLRLPLDDLPQMVEVQKMLPLKEVYLKINHHWMSSPTAAWK